MAIRETDGSTVSHTRRSGRRFTSVCPRFDAADLSISGKRCGGPQELALPVVSVQAEKRGGSRASFGATRHGERAITDTSVLEALAIGNSRRRRPCKQLRRDAVRVGGPILQIVENVGQSARGRVKGGNLAPEFMRSEIGDPCA